MACGNGGLQISQLKQLLSVQDFLIVLGAVGQRAVGRCKIPALIVRMPNFDAVRIFPLPWQSYLWLQNPLRRDVLMVSMERCSPILKFNTKPFWVGWLFASDPLGELYSVSPADESQEADYSLLLPVGAGPSPRFETLLAIARDRQIKTHFCGRFAMGFAAAPDGRLYVFGGQTSSGKRKTARSMLSLYKKNDLVCSDTVLDIILAFVSLLMTYASAAACPEYFGDFYAWDSRSNLWLQCGESL